MKALFLFLIIPVLSFGQTIHVQDEKIVYEGKEKIALSSSEIFGRIQKALPGLVSNYEVEEQSGNSVKARGKLKLQTPYYLVRTVTYSIKLSAVDNGYEYQIDSVSFNEQERGKKMVTKSSKEMLDNMSETGAIVGETEKILNETDMRFQKLLAVLKSKVKGD